MQNTMDGVGGGGGWPLRKKIKNKDLEEKIERGRVKPKKYT